MQAHEHHLPLGIDHHGQVPKAWTRTPRGQSWTCLTAVFQRRTNGCGKPTATDQYGSEPNIMTYKPYFPTTETSHPPALICHRLVSQGSVSRPLD